MCNCNQDLLDKLSGVLVSGHENSIKVDGKKLSNGDLLEALKVTYCIDPEAMTNEFSKVGITLTEKDLPSLATLAISGGDLKGILKDKNNNPIKFDTRAMLGNINLNTGKISQCKLEFI